MHVCWTARNTGVYDYSVLNPKQVAEILTGMEYHLREAAIGDVITMSPKAQVIPMRYCSETFWYPYFPLQHIRESPDQFIFETLGVFMLHHLRAYLQKVYMDRRAQLEWSIEHWCYKDRMEVEGWREARTHANTIFEVLISTNWTPVLLRRWGLPRSMLRYLLGKPI